MDKYQNFIITLDDGTKHVFTGKGFASSKDKKKRIICNIAFTEPKELPPGYAFQVNEEVQPK